MRGITEPDLAWLLAQLDGKPVPLALATATSVVRRWQSAGWAEAHRVLAGEPRLITATTRAATLVGVARVAADGRTAPVMVPAWTQMKHVMACSRVRLAVEAELGPELVEWQSDRAIRAASAELVGMKASLSRAHKPDGKVILGDGRRIAVEVELTPKTPDRVDQILDEVLHNVTWDYVAYFASEPAARAIQAGFQRRSVPGKNPLTLHRLPDLGQPSAILGQLGVTGSISPPTGGDRRKVTGL
jgi:hypothetical protein